MASTTPYRRSSRVASRTPAPAPRSAAGSVNQSIRSRGLTPSHSTVGLPAGLPRVSAQQSRAYGSAGLASRAADLGVPGTGLEAFDSHRKSAVERDVSASRSSSSSPSRIEEEIFVGTEQSTLLDSSKSFGAVHEAGLHASAPLPRQTSQRGGTPPPSSLSIFYRIARANWLNALKFLAVLMAFLLSIHFIYPLVSASSFDVFPSSTWATVKNGLSSGISVSSGLYSRLSRVEKSVQDIQKHLPDHIVVRVDDTTGEPVISDAFWRALHGKFSREGLSLTTKLHKEAEWKQFLANNEMKIESAISNDRKKLLDHFSETFSLARAKHQVLTRDEFAQLMQKDYLEMSGRVEKEVERVAKQIGSYATRQQIRLESLAYANLLANSELSLKTVNFFSPGLGAKVDPRLTSPTQTKEVSLKAKLFTTFFWSPPRHPPVTALERWEEASDCWCTAASDTHQAQLAVNMAYPIYPTRLTIENIPKEGTLNWKSAPKDLELWVEIKDERKRIDVQNSWDMLNTKPCSDSAPGSKYVCIGTMRYDMYGQNHVQTFDLELDLKAHHVEVTNTVVRVVETWGSPWTCIYRIRMHGEHDE